MTVEPERKNYFQHELSNEVMIYVFKYVKNPINLIVSCMRWSFICKDSQAKAEWIIYRFGRAHCIFHAIRLGPTFISVEVARAIITKGGILSRYFAQRLLIHYGNYDQELIELKIAHRIGQTDIDSIRTLQQKIIPWASNLQITVYQFLLSEAFKVFNADLYLKGNDMELFHFLSGGSHTINYAPTVLEKNYEEIKDLILCKKFVPFPPRKSSDTLINSPEEYPPKDGHENNRQILTIARAITIRNDLVLLWKKIGYFEICEDVNDLVLRGALLILFPSAQPSGWIKPDAKAVKARLIELIGLGFQLNYSIIIDIFHLFESRLDDIGKILVESFKEIKQEPQDHFFRRCLTETLNNAKLKKISNITNIMNFFHKYLPNIAENEFDDAFNLCANRSKIQNEGCRINDSTPDFIINQ